MALGKTVGQLLTEISSYELTEWMAFYQICPFGEERDDLRTGITTSVMANAFRGKGQRPFKPKDFMPDFEKGWRDERMSVEEMQHRLILAFGKPTKKGI